MWPYLLYMLYNINDELDWCIYKSLIIRLLLIFDVFITYLNF